MQDLIDTDLAPVGPDGQSTEAEHAGANVDAVRLLIDSGEPPTESPVEPALVDHAPVLSTPVARVSTEGDGNDSAGVLASGDETSPVGSRRGGEVADLAGPGREPSVVSPSADSTDGAPIASAAAALTDPSMLPTAAAPAEPSIARAADPLTAPADSVAAALAGSLGATSADPAAAVAADSAAVAPADSVAAALAGSSAATSADPAAVVAAAMAEPSGAPPTPSSVGPSVAPDEVPNDASVTSPLTEGADEAARLAARLDSDVGTVGPGLAAEPSGRAMSGVEGRLGTTSLDGARSAAGVAEQRLPVELASDAPADAPDISDHEPSALDSSTLPDPEASPAPVLARSAIDRVGTELRPNIELGSTAGGETPEPGRADGPDADDPVWRQVQRALGSLRTTSTGDQQLTIRLRPDTLGSILVRISTGEAGTTVALVADSMAAATQLQQQRQQLVSELQSSGLRSVAVDIGTGDQDAARQQAGASDAGSGGDGGGGSNGRDSVRWSSVADVADPAHNYRDRRFRTPSVGLVDLDL